MSQYDLFILDESSASLDYKYFYVCMEGKVKSMFPHLDMCIYIYIMYSYIFMSISTSTSMHIVSN